MDSSFSNRRSRDLMYQQGQRRLKQLLPWARAEAKRVAGTAEYKISSPLAEASMPYVTEDNLDALVIYPAPLGGFHADIVLKQVPPGMSDCFGTPVGSPCKTFAEAEESGKRSLVMALLVAADNVRNKTKQGDPVFWLDDWVFKLSAELLQKAMDTFGVTRHEAGYATEEIAIQRIEEIKADLFPNGMTKASIDGLSKDDRARLLTVLHMAAMTGIFVYPPRRDASPSGHSASEQSKVVH
jgi:hypothetical protein